MENSEIRTIKKTNPNKKINTKIKEIKKNALLKVSKILKNFSKKIKIFMSIIFIIHIFSYEDYQKMQEFLNLSLNNTLLDPLENLVKSQYPKISIVIALYNGEGYLKNGLMSIQNQDFKDIEIIFVDDFSRDNSTDLVRHFMEKDPRIILLKNEENKGTLYTKAKGVLNSKGKYVMIFDQDDMYTQRNALSTAYNEIEKYNLDMLGFSAKEIYGYNINTKKFKHKFRNYIKTPILYQPDIPKRMYKYTKSGNVIRVGSVLWNYIIKNELFKKIIGQIDEIFLSTKMVRHEDYLFLFLLTRSAISLKQIKKIFYVQIVFKKSTNKKINFSLSEKQKNKENLHCMSFINYIEFLLMKTNDTVQDKKIASFELNRWYLKECRENQYVRERGVMLCKLFLNNKYIENGVKKKILNFMDEINEMIIF